MASCKDCVHVEVCCKKNLHVVVGMNITPRFKYKHIEQECKHFKDRSRFVELPIKPGEKIFYFDTAGRIYESTVNQLVYGATGFLIDSDVMFNSDLIGERFFLTREAAEQTLKERESNAGRNDT